MEHHFTPTRYYTTLGPHPPVLQVGDGDTLVTTTVDAWGIDHRREQVTPRSNPQTGPFYVEGAEPGDTLAVDLEEIRPNRAYGFCYSAIAPNVVDPDYVRQLPPALVAEWKVDAEKGTATLVGPESKLGELVIPLEPMLGCFGVAAKGGQAISTATSAEHGGNMDYRGFVAGTTVYFPVFEPGALFFLGDGHAVQGGRRESWAPGSRFPWMSASPCGFSRGSRSAGPGGENDEWIFRCRATPGRWTRPPSTPPPRCSAGCSRTTAWMGWAPICCCPSASATSWETSSIRPIPWSAR